MPSWKNSLKRPLNNPKKSLFGLLSSSFANFGQDAFAAYSQDQVCGKGLGLRWSRAMFAGSTFLSVILDMAKIFIFEMKFKDESY